MADPSTTDHSFATLRVEREINERLGGDATIRDLVSIMLRLGWTPPTTAKRDASDE